MSMSKAKSDQEEAGERCESGSKKSAKTCKAENISPSKLSPLTLGSGNVIVMEAKRNSLSCETSSSSSANNTYSIDYG